MINNPNLESYLMSQSYIVSNSLYEYESSQIKKDDYYYILKGKEEVIIECRNILDLY